MMLAVVVGVVEVEGVGRWEGVGWGWGRGVYFGIVSYEASEHM